MTDADWQTIFGVEPPIEEEPSDIQAIITEFEQRRATAQAIVDRFASVQSGGVAGHLEGDVGPAFHQVVSEVHAGLTDLPRIAGQVVSIFSHHKEKLEGYRAASDTAIARARTSWNNLNSARSDLSSAESRVRSLRTQVENAADDVDTAGTESSIDGLETSIGRLDGDIRRYQAELDDVYVPGLMSNCTYHDLRSKVTILDDETVAALRRIDRGDLDDPAWWQKVGSAIGDFAVGLVESAVNLLEAFVTGDWATFFWELKNLLNAAILVLGTIALFTGVGAPLFFLALAAFAVTAGLYVTKTPNPQTGDVVGTGELILSAVGVVFGAGGVYRAFTPGMFTNAEKGLTGMKLFTGGPGSLQTFATDARNFATLIRGLRGGATPAAVQAAADLKMASFLLPHGRTLAGIPVGAGIVRAGSVAYTGAKITYATRGRVGAVQKLTGTSLGPLDAVTGTDGQRAYNDAAGAPARNIANGPDWGAMWDGPLGPDDRYGGSATQGTPIFGPRERVQIGAVREQLANASQVTIISAR